ncbi:hypothetical protein [Noviherbaspirillum pedocola]|uniref:Uncharacterized protein n=1 Tax=Noviherbaspirillum pedocola TaxID=2801341 RepID=A0A934SZU9_9BURK|nr:hypothetical protein [Noviherbaspirillum pedocola]MBK4738739.1 hypothetical protein [Noviherbaspirillum pedocola]
MQYETTALACVSEAKHDAGNDTPVIRVPMSRDQVDAYVRACHAEMTRRLRSYVPVPAGHVWNIAHDALAWFLGDAIQSTVSGTPFFINRAQGDEHDDKQFSIEVRYFWQQRTLKKNGKTEMVGSNDRHKVILWVRKGKLFAGQNHSLLECDAAFLYADSVADIATQVAVAIARALDRGYEPTQEAQAALCDALEKKAMREYRELSAADKPMYEIAFLKGFDGMYIPPAAIQSTVALNAWMLGHRFGHAQGAGVFAYRRKPS